MKKKAYALALASILALTACGTTNTASQPTQEPAPSTSTVTVTAEPTTAETTDAVNVAESSAPAPIATSGKEYFNGTTLKGNDISFLIHDSDTRTEINKGMKEFNLVGSWGIICSRGALPEQLTETAIESYGITGERSVWKSVKYAVAENNVGQEDLDIIADALDSASSLTVDGRSCTNVFSDNPVASASTATASVGRYMGADQVIDLAPLL